MTGGRAAGPRNILREDTHKSLRLFKTYLYRNLCTGCIWEEMYSFLGYLALRFSKFLGLEYIYFNIRNLNISFIFIFFYLQHYFLYVHTKE
jgi:hypothetical protein